jgi:hypothetical protein
MPVDLNKLPEDVRNTIGRGTHYVRSDRELSQMSETELYEAWLKGHYDPAGRHYDLCVALALRALDAIRAAEVTTEKGVSNAS